MPFGNGTGPNGMGPMTGRGAGYCAGFSNPGYMNPAPGGGLGRGTGRGFGRGFGRGMGRGFGRGFVNMFAPGWGYGQQGPTTQPAADPKHEMRILKQQSEALKDQLDDIEQRMAELSQSDND